MRYFFVELMGIEPMSIFGTVTVVYMLRDIFMLMQINKFEKMLENIQKIHFSR